MRRKECTARAITNEPRAGEDVVVFKGSETSEHQHPPNREQVQTIQLAATLKRKAAEHPGQPPTQIMRDELACVSTAVLSQLPEREALSKTMRRERRRNLPPNPRTLRGFEELPRRFRRTLLGETFLFHDSRDKVDDEDEPEDGATGESGTEDDEHDATECLFSERDFGYMFLRNEKRQTFSGIFFLVKKRKIFGKFFFGCLSVREKNSDKCHSGKWYSGESSFEELVFGHMSIRVNGFEQMSGNPLDGVMSSINYLNFCSG